MWRRTRLGRWWRGQLRRSHGQEPAPNLPKRRQRRTIFAYILRIRRGLWCQRFFDRLRQGIHAFDESGNGPQLLVGIPFAIGEHPRAADAVFCHPENLCLGIFRPHLGQLRNRRIQRIAGFVGRFPQGPVASGALSEIHLSPGYEVLISRLNRVGDFRRMPLTEACTAADMR
jgi:hypothetical protein